MWSAMMIIMTLWEGGFPRYGHRGTPDDWSAKFPISLQFTQLSLNMNNEQYFSRDTVKQGI